MHGVRITWLVLGLLAVGACRGRPAYGPEDVIFNTIRAPTPLVTQTIYGTVSCATCDRNSSSMMIEARLTQSLATDPMIAQTFPFIGAYEIALKVAYNEEIELTARIFAPGGVRVLTRTVHATNDHELTEAAMQVDLSVSD